MNHESVSDVCYSAATAQTFRRMTEASELVARNTGVRLHSHRLLDMCLVVGLRPQGLRQMVQDIQHNGSEASDASPEVLSIHTPPFISTQSSPETCGTNTEANTGPGLPSGQLPGSMELPKEHLRIPRGIDLCGLPELCFPDGFHLDTEGRDDSFHFLVLTDILGDRQHGVVLQVHREIKESDLHPAETPGSEPAAEAVCLQVPYAICVITKFPYYTALKDCLSCLLSELTACSEAQFQKKVKEFAAQLALVPCPPPGPLQLSFELGPLNIVLPPPEDVGSPVIDISLHLPFLCFTPETILQILTNILMERRMVFLSSHRPLLTLVTECFVYFLHPLQWRHTYIPVLGSQMLDLLMAPTVFLMGCHSRHMDIVREVEELVVVDIDNGRILTTQCKEVETPPLPTAIVDQFLTSARELPVKTELALSHLASCTSLASAREREHLRRFRLNQTILHIFLQLIGSLLRDVPKHLNIKHRVFIKKEFLDTREQAAQPFYISLLKTDLFHCFLKARLNQKMDTFSRWELSTRSQIARVSSRAATVPRSSNTLSSNSLRKSRDKTWSTSLQNSNSAEPLTLISPNKPNRTAGGKAKEKLSLQSLQLPPFPSDPLESLSVSHYYTTLVVQISRYMEQTASEDTETLAVCLYLRGIIRLAQGQCLQALLDLQNLEKIDMNAFPLELVKQTLEQMSAKELRGVMETEELQGLLHDIMEKHWDRAQPEQSVKDFELPRVPLNEQDFAVHIQAAGLVSNPSTINTLFNILSDGQPKVVNPKVFNELYSHWKKMKSEVDSVVLDPEVDMKLLESEQVSLVSTLVKTNCGQGRLVLSQKRLGLLMDADPHFKEIARLRDIEEVEPVLSTSGIPRKMTSLRIKVRGRKEPFVPNLKAECDVWKVLIRELRAGKELAERHKDPQYDQQALSNIQLIHAMSKCDFHTRTSHAFHTRTSHAIHMLAQLDRTVSEVSPNIPKVTTDALKHTLHLSDSTPSPCSVIVLLYLPGSLDPCESVDTPPALWCALSDGRLLIYNAASWLLEQPPIQVGRSRLNCMIGVGREQVWIGSEDSFIYIVSTRHLTCHRRLIAHRNQVTGMWQEILPGGEGGASQVYSCSLDGTIVLWDPASMEMKSQFQLEQCWQLTSIALHRNHIWCCVENSLVIVARDGNQLQKVTRTLAPQGGSILLTYFLILPQGEVWMLCRERCSLYVYCTDSLNDLVEEIPLPAGVHLSCMIHVKKQVWVGGGTADGSRGRIYIINTETHLLQKELEAACGPVRALCPAEDRYMLSATEDSKVIIWKVD
ncbi:DENN domain-containing protein 3-like [Hypanus sabinus]|uniref:DENN domain-containing protein 3-like n=1 Tax=Hypanus sabinus TaxID=79690 RepID=UPI0028C4E029|nr:DENN domain-containing protein 3-like [Hypanus sabinus]